MPTYIYRAVYPSGQLSTGEMICASETELAGIVKRTGLELIYARETRTRDKALWIVLNKTSLRQLASLCGRLYSLLRAGISFSDALHDMRLMAPDKRLAQIITQISTSIASGQGIAASFAAHPKHFSPIFIALISAGEHSGDMAKVMDALARALTRQAVFHERLTKALRYPTFLFLVAGGAAGFMMTTVVPQIVLFLNGLESRLPTSTKILLSLSTCISRFAPSIIASIVAIIALFLFARRFWPTHALLQDSLLLRIPLFGPIILKTQLARFFNSFSILIRNSCDVPQSLGLARGTLTNKALARDIESAGRNIIEGKPLSAALAPSLPIYAATILKIGERTGDLSESLDDIANIFDRESSNAIDNFLGVLEPSLTLAIGALLAWTVFAVLGPLYSSLAVIGVNP